MPRVTRKTVAESPARMSPRASTKASTTSSRPNAPSTSTESPRTSRSRRGKSPAEEEQVDTEPVQVIETKRTSRGRQQKPGGDAEEEILPEKPVSRGRSTAKKGAKAEDAEIKPSGRSRSRAAKKEEAQAEEVAVETPSKGRGRTKTEENKELVEEGGRVSRSRQKEKPDETEEKETPSGSRSRSRSSKKDQPQQSNAANSRSRRGGKADEPADDNQTRSRSSSRTKAEPKPSPEPEQETSRGRGTRRGKKAPSPSNESVGSSRSSSRSRASKAQSEDTTEPVETKTESGRGKAKANGSAKGASKRGAAKAEEKEEEEAEPEMVDATPTGRRSGRARKVEASPTTPTKKRRGQVKKGSPEVAKDEEPVDDEPAVELEKPEDEETIDDDSKKETEAPVQEIDEKEEKGKEEEEESKPEVMDDEKETDTDKVIEEDTAMEGDETEDTKPAEAEEMDSDKAENEELPEELEDKSPLSEEDKSEVLPVDEPKPMVEEEECKPPAEDEVEEEPTPAIIEEEPKAPVKTAKAKPTEEEDSPEVDKAPEKIDMQEEENVVENMELDGIDKEPVQSSLESRSVGQKRKFENDDSVEESESKRVCEREEVTPEPTPDITDSDIKPVEEPMIHTAQHSAIEAISDVSSAEEEPSITCDSWPAPPVLETSTATAVAQDIQEPVALEPVEEAIPSDDTGESKNASSQSPQKTSESLEKPNHKADEEDLTSGYVVINLEDVPPSDSTQVKEGLPAHQNHTDQVKNAKGEQEEEAMEVDEGLAVDEQNKPDVPVKSVEDSITTKSPDTILPVSSIETKKAEVNIAKPPRIFEPSPDIFHRSCVCNPTLINTSVPEGHAFTVASYNILAECHRKRDDYSYTEEKYLEQEHRHQLLVKELQYLDADVVCMQEVNPEYYNKQLEPALLGFGYKGSFMKRTWTDVDEGEATFVKTTRFTVESAKGVSLAELSKKNISESGLGADVQATVEEYLDRADVVNITRLRCKQTDKVLTIGNIHVVWDQLRSPDIQSIQIATAVKEVVSQAGSDSSPHILCGDFNSVPSSVGYQLAQDGYLSDSSIATLQKIENLKLPSGSKALVNHLWGAFQHTSSNLTSAYRTCQGEEPEITTFTRHMLECVDYLFYGNAGLEVSDIMRVVDRNVIEDTPGLPTQEIPSDHLSLKATFFFR